jgi:hypothetical protein
MGLTEHAAPFPEPLHLLVMIYLPSWHVLPIPAGHDKAMLVY